MRIANLRVNARPMQVVLALLLGPVLLAGLAANAAVTDISNAPLFTSSLTVVKPNLMFILDDSGSMKSDFLPDQSNFSATKYGKKTAQCNGVAYNPNVNYTLPVDTLGTPVAPASLSFITPDPATQTSSHRALSSIAAMPTVTSGTFTYTVTTGSRRSGWYSAGDTVTIYQTSTQYFVGTVVSWNSTSGAIVINMAGGTIAGSGAMGSPTIGDGQPNVAIYYNYTGTQPKLSYTYTSAGVITTTTFYRECNSVIGVAPGSAVFTPVTVTSASAEAQNYANWFQYYRSRITMMKSSISLAFKSLDSRYRVGYSTISETNAAETTPASDFLHIRDFDATQKAAFYKAFNAAVPSSFTPLRGALSKAGQYFATKAPSQTIDPIQYSCQRNFTILSTDGNWNTPDESTTAPKYGPYKLNNNTNVGQQDGSPTLPPMLDGGNVTITTTETWTSTSVTSTTTVTPQSTLTSRVSGTTTVTPLRGFSKSTYSLPVKVGVSSMGSRPSSTSPFYVTVTTSAPHNFQTGDTITITYTGSGSATGYAGTASIVRISATQFKYPSTSGSRPGSGPPGSASNYKAAPASAVSCAVGSGQAIQQQQTQDELTVSMSTLTSSTTTNSTLTSTVTRTQKTPLTRTVVQANGVVVSDNTVSGSLVATSTTTSSISASPSVTATNLVTAAAPNTFTAWVNSGSPTVISGCTTTQPPDSAPVAAAISTSANQTTSGPTTTGPTASSGTPAATTAGPTVSETAHVSNSSSSSTGGVSDSLADVAAYYYNTDLRDAGLANCTGALGTDICNNNVSPQSGDAAHSFGDSAKWQHMTTFTLGLGISGLLNYSPNYLTQVSGDFFEITNGNKNWPTPGPTKGPENVDDLWHAAVNGRGQYFSAGDPNSLSTSLSTALSSIQKITGAAAAASTSSLQPVEGDNDIYVAQFTSVEWTGDLLAFKILANATITGTATWSAQAQLGLQTPASRTIYYPSGTALKTFTYANLATDALNGLFDNFCSKTAASGGASPSQCSGLSTANLGLANTGANLVSYLRGDQTLAYYRTRAKVLGDIINASPLFIGKPNFKYLDASYTAFAADKAGRTAVVLAAANDGMLHAFDRATGSEQWAFIPSFVMPKMYKLADDSYKDNHSYFVDGSPQMGDIFVGGAWKTIVVGGLGAGGRGFYALDVTNPVAPQLLWEYSNDELGLTFGNPIITKRADGTWVVVFASGYNNVSPGTGNGHLFVLNANTGTLLKDVPTFTSGTTPAGTAAQPSGLAKLNAWVDSETNNLARRFYGGDLLGNLWRFDIDDLVAPNEKALLLASMTLTDGTPQPITVKPSLAEIDYNSAKYPVVYVATGQYLGATDLPNTTQQSIYAVKDPLLDATLGNLRTNPLMVTQTMTIGTDAQRTITSNPVDWSTKAGWKVDLPGPGERVNVNPQLVLNTLTLGSNVPSIDACTSGGSSFLYKFDITTGSTAAGETNVGTFLGNVLVEGLTTVQLGSSESSPGSIVTIITRSDATLETSSSSPSSSSGALRRTSWRELVD